MDLLVITQNSCSGCTELKNHLDGADETYVSINISNNPEAIEKYDIMGAPTAILLEDGEELTRLMGYDADKVDDLLQIKEENE